MGKLIFKESKTLKLTNVLKYRILLEDENFNMNVVIEQMQSYIRTKGAIQIGPLIQCTKTHINEAGELEMEIYLMLQANNFIHNVEHPYSMESVLRVENAYYCRYIGAESTLKYAYDKIGVEAFERDGETDGCSYTIFVDSNEEEETMVADIFVPRKNDEVAQ